MGRRGQRALHHDARPRLWWAQFEREYRAHRPAPTISTGVSNVCVANRRPPRSHLCDEFVTRSKLRARDGWAHDVVAGYSPAAVGPVDLRRSGTGGRARPTVQPELAEDLTQVAVHGVAGRRTAARPPGGWLVPQRPGGPPCTPLSVRPSVPNSTGPRRAARRGPAHSCSAGAPAVLRRGWRAHDTAVSRASSSRVTAAARFPPSNSARPASSRALGPRQ